MKKVILALVTLSGLVGAASTFAEGDFDGSRPLLFSIATVMECTFENGCTQVTPGSIDLPDFLKIDFANGVVVSAIEGDERPPSPIERSEVVDGKLIIQGAEDGYEKATDGLGWTIAVSEATGRAILSASGDGFAIVAFGATLPL
jgi:hypothetical protein